MDSAPRRWRTEDFDFVLPPELIARAPAVARDGARMLLRPRDAAAPLRHARVVDLPAALAPGDLLVFNDTRVLPARVLARRPTGGRVELLFHAPATDTDDPLEWAAFARPAKKIKPGEVLAPERDGGVGIEAVSRVPGEALWRVRIVAEDGVGVEEALERVGEVPLPPYIDRAPTAEDRERYQTIYATAPGAVAAPTAGLHFTDALLDALRRRGVEQTFVTLHVGAGTFLPVSAEHVDEHRMHEERFVLPVATREAVARCRERGGRVVAVGTTSARVLESCAAPGRLVEARSGATDIFLHPDARPRVIDGLFTNFHLPKSTLLMLVSSLVGVDAVLDAYRAAVEERYRFYSYGDAMLLL